MRSDTQEDWCARRSGATAPASQVSSQIQLAEPGPPRLLRFTRDDRQTRGGLTSSPWTSACWWQSRLASEFRPGLSPSRLS